VRSLTGLVRWLLVGCSRWPHSSSWPRRSFMRRGGRAGRRSYYYCRLRAFCSMAATLWDPVSVTEGADA
jgi:hypothetical protein